MRTLILLLCPLLCIITLATGCSTPEPKAEPSNVADASESSPDMMREDEEPDQAAPLSDMASSLDASTATESDTHADVTGVTVSGTSGAYRFAVTLRSPDTGCAQYADWWEVLTPEGELLYRRILAHSHVDEQPFTRSGGPIAASSGQQVIVRGHMNETGYGGAAMQVTLGEPATVAPIQRPDDFAAGAEELEPQPNGCAF